MRTRGGEVPRVVLVSMFRDSGSLSIALRRHDRLVVRGRGDGLRHSVEPYLAEKVIDGTRTESATVIDVLRETDTVLEDHHVVLEVDHLSGLLVDDLFQASGDAERSTRRPHHLRVPPQTSVAERLVDRLEDLRKRANAHHFSGLEVQPTRRRLHSVRHLPAPLRVWRA